MTILLEKLTGFFMFLSFSAERDPIYFLFFKKNETEKKTKDFVEIWWTKIIYRKGFCSWAIVV